MFPCWRCGRVLTDTYYEVYVEAYYTEKHVVRNYVKRKAFLCPECFQHICGELSRHVEERLRRKAGDRIHG